MKKITFSFIALAISAAMAAQPRAVAVHETIDMGPVIWKTPATATFTIQNKGDQPLTIQRVLTSCGCTRVMSPKEPIAPGASASVVATYDAAILGHFNKTIGLFTNASTSPMMLRIQGDVVVEKVNYSADYPYQVGSVSIDRNEVEFDNVNNGDHPQQVINIINRGRSSYTPELMHLPPYLSAKMEPERVLGGKKGRIVLTLNSDTLHSMGLTQTSIYLSRFQGDKVEDKNEITVSAVLIPDFSRLSAQQLQQAPRMTLSEDAVKFNMSDGKEKKDATIIISNEGASNLEISSLQLFNRAISASLSRRIIKPGSTSKLEIEVEARYLKSAKGQPRVLMITNDPTCPKKIIPVDITD